MGSSASEHSQFVCMIIRISLSPLSKTWHDLLFFRQLKLTYVRSWLEMPIRSMENPPQIRMQNLQIFVSQGPPQYGPSIDAIALAPRRRIAQRKRMARFSRFAIPP